MPRVGRTVSDKLRGDLRTVAVTALTVAVITCAPAVAGSVVRFARNADKVDGKHAVSAGASVAKRKGKLVATSSVTGRLPNDIIAKARDAEKLDGLDSGSFALSDFLKSPGQINQSVNPVDWTKLAGVPADLADGADDYGPRAWAHVASNGVMVADDRVDDLSVTTGGTKNYCIQLSFTPELALVTPELRSGALAAGVQAYASVDPTVVDAAGYCPGLDAEAMVTFRSTSSSVQADFFVSFMDVEPTA
jgi:hypothetical protein